MSHLPFEILRPIFDDLEAKEDLLQCQLTCKYWYEASVLLFYLKIIDTKHLLLTKINTDEDNVLATNTFGDDNTFNKNDKCGVDNTCGADDMCDTDDSVVLTIHVIIQQCPNVSEIRWEQPSEIFWQRLSEAAARGQLLHLSKLIFPTQYNTELYIKTALCFTSSLQSLYIYEEGFFVDQIFSSARVFMKFRRRISEFIRLRRLDILFLAYRQLNHLDGLIEDCPHLEKININMCFAGMDLVEVETVMPINPRPDICIFKSQSTITVTNMDQLKYVMQKFTKLQRLQISFDLYSEYVYRDSDSTSNVLAQFFDYLMPLAICETALTVPKSKFIDAWNEFICRTDQMSNNSTVFPHVAFLLNSGGRIRSLQIEDIRSIFQQCPSLHALTSCNPKDMVLTGDLVYQHTKLESLTVTQLEPDQHYEFLRHFSFCLPKLKKVHLHYNDNYPEDKPMVIKVDLPNSSLDSLNLEYDLSNFDDIDNSRLLVKLKTKEDIKFYVISDNSVLVVDEEEFDELLFNTLCAEINCKSLKELRTVTYPFPYNL
ncbi:hypothetical protein MFLAVUS_000775 [Mucor flavus]|uniref:F-box domain-containing protein n=1 Tax=Mucor flavus TaxID=439312 RepID=A0ABP9YKL9_9FUNG